MKVPVPAPVIVPHGRPAATIASRVACASCAGRSDRQAPFGETAAVLRGAEVGVQSAQRQAGQRVDRAPQRHGGDGVGHAGAVMADVELDVDVDPRLRVVAGLRQFPHGIRIVDTDAEPRRREARGEPGQMGELAFADDLVGDEHVLDAAGKERLGLGRLLHADADRARGDLAPGDLDALVALRVRPHAHIAARDGLHQARRCWRRTCRGRRSVPAYRRRRARRRRVRESSACPCVESSERVLARAVESRVFRSHNDGTQVRAHEHQMSIKSDKWIRRMAADKGMIEPFEPGQVREVNGQRIVSYGTSSYGYDIRCATNSRSSPTSTDDRRSEDVRPELVRRREEHVCIIPPNSFALARTVEYFRIPAQRADHLPGQEHVRALRHHRQRHAARAGVGRPRDAGVLQHHAAAREDLRGRGLRAGAVPRVRRGLRDLVQGSRRASTRDSAA